MHERVCVCTRVYVCMHACIHACMHACLHACLRACMHACVHACIARMCVCMNECMYVVAVRPSPSSLAYVVLPAVESHAWHALWCARVHLMYVAIEGGIHHNRAHKLRSLYRTPHWVQAPHIHISHRSGQDTQGYEQPWGDWCARTAGRGPSRGHNPLRELVASPRIFCT